MRTHDHPGATSMSDAVQQLFGGPPDPETPPSDRSDRRRFVRDVIVWARGPGALRTTALPEHELPVEGGASRLDGHQLRSDRFARHGYVGLLGASATALAAMVGERLGASWLADAVTLGLAVVTLVALGLAILGWRRARVFVHVAIVDQPEPVDPKQLAQLGTRRVGGRAGSQRWIVARRGFTNTAVSLAHVMGVRCLVPGPAGLRAVEPAASTAPSVRLVEAFARQPEAPCSRQRSGA